MGTVPLSIAVTADLHWGTRHPTGRQATLDLVAHLAETPPDVFILAGDVGAGDDFERCLELFDRLPSKKALVPGNHDLWVNGNNGRGDSRAVFREALPRLSREHGFTYLDRESLLLPDHDL